MWIELNRSYSARLRSRPLWSENPRYFEELIRDHMLGNPHRVTLKLLPDPELLRRLEAEERRRLERAKAMMSPDELEAIFENTRRSREFREITPGTPVALPALRRADLIPETAGAFWRSFSPRLQPISRRSLTYWTPSGVRDM